MYAYIYYIMLYAITLYCIIACYMFLPYTAPLSRIMREPQGDRCIETYISIYLSIYLSL